MLGLCSIKLSKLNDVLIMYFQVPIDADFI